MGNETIDAILQRATALAGANVNIKRLESLQTSGEDALATVEQGCNYLAFLGISQGKILCTFDNFSLWKTIGHE